LLSVFAVSTILIGAEQTAIGDELHPKLDPALRIALEQATDASSIRVVVTARSGQLPALRARMLGRGNAISAQHQFIGALTAQLRVNDVRALETDPIVDHISLDHVVRSTAGPPPAAAPHNQAILGTLGLPSSSITGKGVGVAVLDSGLQPSTTLPAFAFKDFVTGAGGAAYDDYGHGTHISGLIRSSADPRGGGVAGVASGVRLISMKVLDGTGQGFTSTVLTALESVLDNRGAFGIDVINLSLGHPITESAATDPLVRAVEALSRAGVVVVVAAGNWGGNPQTGLPAYAGITVPGNAPSAITVGALDTNQTVTRGDDQIPTYSSRGPTWYDGLVKPDIVAPGHSLVSVAAVGSSLYARFPEQRVPDSAGAARFMRLSGTSMSTAVTTGVVALMIERHRRVSSRPLTPNDVKAVLQFTAIPVSGSDVFTQGAGGLNAAGALAVVAALTGTATTDWRSINIIQPTTTLGSDTYLWHQAVIWGHTLVYGDTVYANEPAWGAQTTWGSAVIWGHGSPSPGDLVWDSAGSWSTTTIWDPVIAPSSSGLAWPELGGQVVVWGHGGPH
jgi:serine protease AprX